MRPFGIELSHEIIESSLLLQEVCAGRPSRFLLLGQVHVLRDTGWPIWTRAITHTMFSQRKEVLSVNERLPAAAASLLATSSSPTGIGVTVIGAEEVEK